MLSGWISDLVWKDDLFSACLCCFCAACACYWNWSGFTIASLCCVWPAQSRNRLTKGGKKKGFLFREQVWLLLSYLKKENSRIPLAECRLIKKKQQQQANRPLKEEELCFGEPWELLFILVINWTQIWEFAECVKKAACLYFQPAFFLFFFFFW